MLEHFFSALVVLSLKIVLFSPSKLWLLYGFVLCINGPSETCLTRHCTAYSMAMLVLFATITLATALPSQREQVLGTALPTSAKNVLTYNEGEFMHSFGHYFNGSYKVHDVLRELQANETLGHKYAPK